MKRWIACQFHITIIFLKTWLGYGFTSHQGDKSKGQKTIKYQICYCICFDLVQIKSTTLTRVPEKSFGPLGLQNGMFDIHNSLSVSCPEFVGLFKPKRGCSVPTTPWSTTKYSLSGHFFFFLWGCSGSIYLRLYLVWCIQELNPHINLTPSRLEMPLEIRELKSDQVWGKGGTSNLPMAFTKGGTCSLRKETLTFSTTEKNPRCRYRLFEWTACSPKDTSYFFGWNIDAVKWESQLFAQLSGACDGRVFLWFRWHQHPRVWNWDWKPIEVEFSKHSNVCALRSLRSLTIFCCKKFDNRRRRRRRRRTTTTATTNTNTNTNTNTHTHTNTNTNNNNRITDDTWPLTIVT